ncbi:MULTISPECIES: hypothetical protein [unclassified Leifsonia]|uniref:hypothetical protein n=1 Tax=unclassified Leifsonia TaxID=2663824 RepID=UPI0006F345B0|nr:MULTISPECIES: hypothetical protein [unclassified Leifsonia]KQX07199.1 hypothetical protein ASC59_05225 [Leifsonia sp. Root1293]KRA11482.1 hypothetical protein ASD61_05225 [Leifsonia sp. Root60]
MRIMTDNESADQGVAPDAVGTEEAEMCSLGVPGCVLQHEDRFENGFHQLLDSKTFPFGMGSPFEIAVYQDEDGTRASVWPNVHNDGLSAADLRAAAAEYEKVPALLRMAADRLDAS